jgi:hypothetical protein
MMMWKQLTWVHAGGIGRRVYSWIKIRMPAEHHPPIYIVENHHHVVQLHAARTESIVTGSRILVGHIVTAAMRLYSSRHGR